MEKSQKKILILDDDSEMCSEISDTLRNEGYNVSISKNGLEGFALIADNDFDVVLLDLKLPGLSGYDILDELKERKEELDVIVISGQHIAAQYVNGEHSPDKNDAQKYETLKKADGVLSKPFDMDILLTMLKEPHKRHHVFSRSS